MKPLRPEVWQPIYKRICDDFGFDPKQDLKSANRLLSMLGTRSEGSLEGIAKGFPRSVLICGGADSLADEISSIKLEGFVVAADAATSTLADAGIRLDMIVSDLDGIVEDQVSANAAGTPVFIHAHGDNQPALERYVQRFTGPVVGTCQCPPPPGLYNFGGFTDGDRAACICAELGARELMLVGFDFGNPSMKAGKRRDVKLKKLRWAKTILDVLQKQGLSISYAAEQ